MAVNTGGRDTGVKGTPGGSNPGSEKNSQVDSTAKGAKSGTILKQKATRSQDSARRSY